MPQASAQALISSLDRLKLDGSSKAPLTQKKAQPAESWEDDDSDSSDEDSGTATPVRPVNSDIPLAPPPTPSSPSFSSDKYQTFPPFGFDGAANDYNSSAQSSSAKGGSEDRRPEKSTSVASRMIAAGIGQKAPRRTQEQREYDQAMKVQEKKRRDKAKADEERLKAEKEKATRAIWED